MSGEALAAAFLSSLAGSNSKIHHKFPHKLYKNYLRAIIPIFLAF